MLLETSRTSVLSRFFPSKESLVSSYKGTPTKSARILTSADYRHQMAEKEKEKKRKETKTKTRKSLCIHNYTSICFKFFFLQSPPRKQWPQRSLPLTTKSYQLAKEVLLEFSQSKVVKVKGVVFGYSFIIPLFFNNK